MLEIASIQADYAALNELIVNCPDFDRLESLLGGFNLFQVLKFEHGEIRHSNVLAWILDPTESHGLDSIFLQKWLKRVIHECSSQSEKPVSAVDIDAWQLVDVEVRREWKHIDLLILLTFQKGEQWVVCIENKVNSIQHSNQLSRYRSLVESEFANAARRLYIFLTKANEAPEEESYLSASYSQIHQALRECVQSRSHAIGSEPKVLLENYLRLLEEKFMDESEIAKTALRIYQQHRRALDVIFEHRPDNLSLASDKVRRLLTENAQRLGIIMEPSSKAYLRFIPVSWDQPGNTHGSGWSGSKRSVLFEIKLTGRRPYLYAISGKSPDAWIEPIWIRSALPPFHRPRRNARPQMWCTLHTTSNTKIALDDQEVQDPNDIAQHIYDWAVKSYAEPDTQAVVRIISDELPKLEEAFAAITSE